MERQYQFTSLTGQQHILILKVDIHSEFLQSPEHHQEVDAVAAESTDRFGVDEIDLAGLHMVSKNGRRCAVKWPLSGAKTSN